MASTPGLPTIWELVAEAARSLPEPFTRAAVINWVSARRPDVGVSSIAAHIQYATANAASSGTNPFAGRTPLLRRVDRGRYERYRGRVVQAATGAAAARVLLVASSGEHGPDPAPAASLFGSPGFATARARARRSGAPWFVLSAKHGLLDPTDVIGPYDLHVDERSASYRAAWGEWVVAQLGERMPLEGVTVEVHGGVDFAQPLRQPLLRRGAFLEIPLPGSWRDVEDGDPDAGAEQPEERAAGDPVGGAVEQDHETPVRAALHRLRSLVSGSRGSDPDPGVDTDTGGDTDPGTDSRGRASAS